MSSEYPHNRIIRHDHKVPFSECGYQSFGCVPGKKRKDYYGVQVQHVNNYEVSKMGRGFVGSLTLIEEIVRKVFTGHRKKSMLYFYCLTEKDKIKKKGLKLKRPLQMELADLDGCKGEKLVINGMALHEAYGKALPERIPLEYIMNIDPYLEPVNVTAGGGYVIRPGKKEPKVLCIQRRGVWELPKGKLDKGESIEECALREVREEVGISELELIAPAGATYHAYERKKRFEVKTTHWFLMYTPETDFIPQAEEQIDKVAWKSWSKALKQVVFPNYVAHMRKITSQVMEIDLDLVS